MQISKQIFKQNIKEHKTEYDNKRIDYFKALAVQEATQEADNRIKAKILELHNFKIAP